MVMAPRAWLLAATVILSLASACTAQGPLVRAGATPPTPTTATSQEASPSRQSGTPSPEPTPIPVSISCSATPSAASEPLVIAWASDRQQVVLDSFRDPTHPTPLCAITGGYDFKFISGSEIGYAANSSSNDPIRGSGVIARMNLNDLKPVPVVAVTGEVMDVAWSPDGSSVAYLLYTDAPGLGSGAANQLWIKIGNNAPRPLTPLIPLFGRGGSVDDQILVRFSPDGKYLVMVDTYVAGAAPSSPDQATFQVHSVPDGGLVWVPPGTLNPSGRGQFTTMAAWSHQADRLYYRDQAGVHTWDPPGTVGTMAAGLTWYSPTVSADDRYIAYVRAAGDNALLGQPYVEIRDLTSSSVRDLAGIRSAPWFLSGTLLLEAEYGPNAQQGPGPRYVQTGSTFVYNLSTNAETPLAIVINPIDSWPH
jgi:hypothetical protein